MAAIPQNADATALSIFARCRERRGLVNVGEGRAEVVSSRKYSRAATVASSGPKSISLTAISSSIRVPLTRQPLPDTAVGFPVTGWVRARCDRVSGLWGAARMTRRYSQPSGVNR